jgi:hypothetical protein
VKSIRRGDLLTVAYTDISPSRLERARKLSLFYGFACGCSRCRAEKGDEEELSRLYAALGLSLPASEADMEY